VPGATVRVVLETAPGYVDLLTELLESLGRNPRGGGFVRVYFLTVPL
jgi:hypothetical protein